MSNIRTESRPQMGSFGKNRVPSPNHYYKPAPAEIVFGHMRFLITDRPTDYTISQFIEELKRHGVKDVVRVCEPTYTTEPLRQEGIQILDWEFPDGSPPPKEVRDKWMELLKDRFSSNPGTCVAVHCVAGLGRSVVVNAMLSLPILAISFCRAPVLVALALIEAGLKFEDAVDLIRQNRRGAINQKQLYYLEKYKPTGELKKFRNAKREKECIIM
ncbi:Y phosphatase domain containing protein [Trichuris trichiura]|uniref:Protein tyrosine phosphatase type IVA 3 n=1 Tax=Trichuris trichiura TaxID=36087 RepID=A0A077YZA9_TRITR|nr:Y phosphatase domain containing protein [Trichuris trichiura]